MDGKYSISIIIPFYRGNEFLPRLFSSLEKSFNTVFDSFGVFNMEVILVNDSPNIKVNVPRLDCAERIVVINNEHNQGIQRSRIVGIKAALGKWILLLDQDDEIIGTGLLNQLSLAKQADVVVGNGEYQFEKKYKKMYFGIREMENKIKISSFLKVRNMITSPGQCLIRKNAIPKIWMNRPLKHNGADDWYLWLCLFSEGKTFVCNPLKTYRHNNNRNENLSLNLKKMKESSLEMAEKLSNSTYFSKEEIFSLINSIEFNYLRRSRKIKLIDLIKYRIQLRNLMLYKIRNYF